jgi:glycosyltransferase involved in cell wall biosynthesis
MDLKLSICILTHNRPKLFKRCIESILNNKLPEYEFEILVNNDSSDIKEIYHNNIDIKYFYEKNYDISKLYYFLFKKSKGNHIFFLEDDDYILKNFFYKIDLNYDVNYCEYISQPHIDEGAEIALERQKINRKNKDSKLNDFINNSNFEYFQLSQICFKKNKLLNFPSGNYLVNDLKLFKNIDKNSSFFYINKPCWVQTVDGGDNISFDDLNKDKRFDVNV